MSVGDTIATAANVATAAGVLAAGWQLRLTRRQMKLAFERTFVDRYEGIAARIPLSLLLGSVDAVTDSGATERALFDYFELCEEECYYRLTGRVSKESWCDWWEGISLNMRRPGIRSAWESLNEQMTITKGSNEVRREQFTLLRDGVAALDAGRKYDPSES